jgi:amino acid adenylation domain-containing protein
MNIVEFLAHLQQQGITIAMEAENLKISAPQGLVTPELSGQIKARKSEIVAYLLGNQVAGRAQTSIAPAGRGRPISASDSQRGLWFQYRLEGLSSTYNVPTVYRLQGKLDLPALEKAFQTLIDRHESLRMCFKEMDGEPYLVIATDVHWKLDICHSQSPVPEQELLKAASSPFTLEEAPLFRAHLWTDLAERHTLLLNFHHTIMDGWSQGIFEWELSSVYAAILSGTPIALPALELDYADYAAWQHEWLKSAAFEQGMAYWKKTLQGAPELLELPGDRPRPVVQRYLGKKVTCTLEQGLKAKLEETAHRERITLFMLMHAALAVLLGRYSRQEDILIGVPMANRPRMELKGMLGFFVNTLPLRLDLSENPSLSQLLQQTRRVALEVFTHQDVPFDRLVEGLRPHRDPGFNPIFQVVLNYINLPTHTFHLKNASVQPVSIDMGVSKFELTLTVFEQEQGLHLELQYNSDRFDQVTVERMLSHYRCILEWMSSSPETGINQFDLLTESERRQILLEWNNTGRSHPEYGGLQEIFKESARRYPDAPAVVFEDKEITYSQLEALSDHLAIFLQQHGIGAEKLVAICMDRSAELIVAILGIFKAGGAYVPVDPALPMERKSFILSETQAQIILVNRGHDRDLQETSATILRMDPGWQEAMPLATQAPPPTGASHALAYVIYTSGSTGMPKGVLVPQDGLVNLAEAQKGVFDTHPGDRVLQFSSLNFDASIFEIAMALGSGAAIVLGSSSSILPGPDLFGFLEKNRISHLVIPPSSLANLPPGRLPALKSLAIAGEQCPAELVERWQQVPNIFNLYGPTEATVWTSFARLRPDGSKPTIGSPIANCQVYILDQYHNLAAVGVPGELVIGGAGVVRGYLKREDLTNERFCPAPFHGSPGGRLYHSGDLARWLPDGSIDYLGRLDTQVKLRGYRIEPGEIEATLAQHAQVRQALVVVREDRPGDRRLVAYILPAEGAGPQPAQLRAFLQEKLPAYMVPSAFVFLQAFPLTINGKIDRKALPAPESEEDHQHYVAPRTYLEKRLVAVYQEVLGAGQVGIRDDFFDLGGNSLLAVRLITRIQQETGHLLPLPLLFKDGTVEGLVASLEDLENKPLPNGVVPLRPEGQNIPIFILVSGLYTRNLVNALGVSHPIYGLYPFENEQMVFRDSVQETAGIFQHCLTDFHPEGPYVLLAHCAYGYFAIELARLLSQEGRKVAFLGLLDTLQRENPLNRELHRQILRIQYHRQNLLGKDLPGRLEYARLIARRSLSRGKLAQVNDRVPIPRNPTGRNDFLEAAARLSASYRPTRYEGDATLYLSNHLDEYLQRSQVKKWSRIIRGSLKVERFSGTHMSMLEPPNVAALAASILASLRDIEPA